MEKLFETMKTGVLLLAFLVLAYLATSCVGMKEYLRDNQNSLVDAGVECLAMGPNEYSAGFLYTYVKDVAGNYTEKTASDPQHHYLTVAVVCGKKAYTITCDVTKKPDQSPCMNLRKWLDSTGQAMPPKWK